MNNFAEIIKNNGNQVTGIAHEFDYLLEPPQVDQAATEIDNEIKRIGEKYLRELQAKLINKPETNFAKYENTRQLAKISGVSELLGRLK